ncbi:MULTISPECIES: hypothetical protein [Arthrobacter]|uniref:Glycosyltransferase RgtA/B/C/D-like domain-containing protein n=2 Tax=Arthrobacter TaxID=1663 RepID=A0ABU9KJK7_9MICC|nr:hypothetical protein [Arthrobacter sp. YJM1]MDP5227253.1 hypothetical protein [Arthrobacter sp. YJM1]
MGRRRAQSVTVVRWRWWLHGLISALFVVVAVSLGPGVVWGDTVQYIRIAHELQGDSPDVAWTKAYTEFCEHPSIPYTGSVDDCVTTTMAGHGPVIGYIDRNPQYQAIFTPRIGYPLVSIPLMNLLGDRVGLWLVAVFFCALAGFIFARLAVLAGLPAVAAATAQIAFYALPMSIPHGIALLAEGPTLMAGLVLVWGVAEVLRRRWFTGVLLSLAGFGLVLFFKYSSLMLLTLSVLLLGVLMILFRSKPARAAGFRQTVLGAGLFAASLAVNVVFNFPGLAESLQDTFTGHYLRPPVPDPLQRLVALEGDFLQKFVAAIPANAGYALVVLAALAGFVLAARRRLLTPVSWAVLPLSLYGVLSVVGHPVYTQAERLGSPFWTIVALGAGCLVWALIPRRRGAGQPGAARLEAGRAGGPSDDGVAAR